MTGLRYFHGTTETGAVRLEEKKCVGCGRCVEVCPHGVFSLKTAKGVLKSRTVAEVVDAGACMECGACKKNCLTGAIEVASGVGCVAAIIGGMIRKTVPECGCSSGKKGSCCG